MPTNSGATTFESTAVPLGSTVVLVVSKGAPPVASANAIVTEVVGMPQAKALSAFEQTHVNAQFFTLPSESYPQGTVMAQWPRPGEFAEQGESGALLVSAGYPEEGTSLVGVPRVVGQHETQAQAALQKAGLRSTVVRVASVTVPEGVVLGQLPDERTVVAAAPNRTWIWIVAAVVVLAAILGAAWFMTRPPADAGSVSVPGVVGKTQDAAEAALTDAGLTVGKVTRTASTTATPDTVMAQDPPEGEAVAKGSAVDIVVATKSDLVTVPDVVGQSKDQALQSLARAQLNVNVTDAADDTIAAGDVISQSPKAGQQVPPNTDVGIVVSTGPKNTSVDVPDVVGLAKADAVQTLADVGLKTKSFDTFSSTVPAGSVAGQAPPSGSSVAAGTTIALMVSTGPEPSQGTSVDVPDVVGSSLADATTQIESAGLTVASFTTDGTGKPAKEVVYQTPAGGDTAPKNSQVVLIVSSGN